MSEPKKSNTTAIVIIVGAVLGLCCVTSMAAAMFVGFAAPVMRLGGADVRRTPPNVKAARVAVAPSGLEGVWFRGTRELPEYRDQGSARWNTPAQNGERYVFRDDGTCELDELKFFDAAGCASHVFTSTTDCRWGLAGTQLTIEIGEGVQLTKACDSAVKKSTTLPRTFTAKATLRGDRLTLVQPTATFEFERAP